MATVVTMAILVPLQEVRVGKRRGHALGNFSLEKLRYEPIFKFNGWQGVRVQAMSPLRVMSLLRGKEPEAWPLCFGFIVSEPEPLLKFCAQNGFWDISGASSRTASRGIRATST